MGMFDKQIVKTTKSKSKMKALLRKGYQLQGTTKERGFVLSGLGTTYILVKPKEGLKSR